jgi:hypothetical protein
MTQLQIYQSWKPTVLGHGVDVDKAYGNQCVDVVLSYGEALFHGVAWSTVFPPVPSAKYLFTKHNPKYFDVIANDHTNPNQLPQPGDILVCDATPQAGYDNTFANPDGHTGVVDHCDSNGYTLLQQDGSHPNGTTFLKTVSWKYRPVTGWLRPKLSSTPSPVPSKPIPIPAAASKTVYLPASVLKWRVYNVKGPWTSGHEIAYLYPSKYKGLAYKILATLGSGIYEIQTHDFGKVAIYTGRPGVDTDAVIK